MRRSLFGAMFISAAAIVPAHASTIMQTIPISQSLGDFTPFDINAIPFNPAAGTLDAVTVEITGSYTPKTASDFNPNLPPFPPTTTLSTRLFVFTTVPGPDMFNVNLGTQTAPVVQSGPGAAGIATGAPTPVDQVFDFLGLSSFEGVSAVPQLLVEYGFLTGNVPPISNTGSDLTSFAGDAVVTYTFNVPEPAAMLLLGSGVLGLAALRRR